MVAGFRPSGYWPLAHFPFRRGAAASGALTPVKKPHCGEEGASLSSSWRISLGGGDSPGMVKTLLFTSAPSACASFCFWQTPLMLEHVVKRQFLSRLSGGCFPADRGCSTAHVGRWVQLQIMTVRHVTRAQALGETHSQRGQLGASCNGRAEWS